MFEKVSYNIHLFTEPTAQKMAFAISKKLINDMIILLETTDKGKSGGSEITCWIY